MATLTCRLLQYFAYRGKDARRGQRSSCQSVKAVCRGISIRLFIDGMDCPLSPEEKRLNYLYGNPDSLPTLCSRFKGFQQYGQAFSKTQGFLLLIPSRLSVKVAFTASVKG